MINQEAVEETYLQDLLFIASDHWEEYQKLRKELELEEGSIIFTPPIEIPVEEKLPF